MLGSPLGSHLFEGNGGKERVRKEKEEKVTEKLRLLRKMYYLCKQVSANRRKRRKLRLIL